MNCRLISGIALTLACTLACGSSMAQTVVCDGAAAGGSGTVSCDAQPRDYVYRVAHPSPHTVDSFLVGTHDPDPAHYYSICMPTGWAFSIAPIARVDYSSLTPHGTVSPGPDGQCLYTIVFENAGGAPLSSVPTDFGFNHTGYAHDVDWLVAGALAATANWIDPVGNGTGPVHGPQSCDTLCDVAAPTAVYVRLAGNKDNFDQSDGPEPSSPSPALLAKLNNCSAGPMNDCNPSLDCEFDCPTGDRCFGHTFSGFWGASHCVVTATLCFKLRAIPGGSSNDGFGLMEDGVNLWSVPMNDLQYYCNGDPTWDAGDVIDCCLDLADLPPSWSGITNLLPSLHDGDLDVYIQDDTEVDHLELAVEVCATTASIPLCHPYSIISFNVLPPDPARAAVLASINGQYDYVAGVSCANGLQSWLLNRPINDLNTMDPEHGYIIRTLTSGAGPLTITGTPLPANSPLQLCANWQLISYLPQLPDTRPHSLASVTGPCAEVLTYEPCTGTPLLWHRDWWPWPNNFNCLEPGLGYWVLMDAPGTLTYPTTGYSCPPMMAPTNEIAPPQAPAVTRAAGAAHTATDPIVTPWWADYWSVSATIGGQPLAPGDVITAVDPDGVLCGRCIVENPGEYLLHVVGDDTLTTTVDEGAESGDEITLYCNGGSPNVSPIPWDVFTSAENSVDFGGCACPYQNDYDTDGFLTALDLGTLIDVLFAGRPEDQDPDCPTSRGDSDCDGFPTSLDLSVVIDHLFAGGEGPCDPCAP